MQTRGLGALTLCLTSCYIMKERWLDLPYILIEAQCASVRAWVRDCASINFNNKAHRLVPTIRIYIQ